MGWWEEDELLLGDEPMDLVVEAIEQASTIYKKRRKTGIRVAELARVIELALADPDGAILEELCDHEVSGVVIKTKKIPKRIKYSLGDVVCIPTKVGYFYGRVLALNVFGGHIFEIFELRSKSKWSFHKLCSHSWPVRTHKLIFLPPWPIIGNRAIPPDYEHPYYYTGGPSFTQLERHINGNEESFRVWNDDDRVTDAQPVMPYTRYEIVENLEAGNLDPWRRERLVKLRDNEDLSPPRPIRPARPPSLPPLLD